MTRNKIQLAEDRQTLFDLAIQRYGDVGGAVQLLVDNADKVEDVTTPPGANTLLKIYGGTVNNDVLTYFTKNKLKPVSIGDADQFPGDYNIDYNNDYYN